jgi:hypothetical protein
MEAAAGRAIASRFFGVLKGASLRVARSDWTAAGVLLFKMVASHELRFVLPRMLASFSKNKKHPRQPREASSQCAYTA